VRHTIDTADELDGDDSETGRYVVTNGEASGAIVL
jgi:hypothetical protein